MNLQSIINQLPQGLKVRLYRGSILARDVKETLTGARDELTPPYRLRHMFVRAKKPEHFRGGGQRFLEFFREQCGLLPSHNILEIGCGCGRTAVPLTDFITEGTYRGLDIIPDGVEWCATHITPKFPNFHFEVADVYNPRYNPKGQAQANEYRLPYDDGSFDFIFLTSVFTHMVTDEMQNYLGEISRVLRPGGCCYITYFLLNEEAERLTAEGKSDFNFKHPVGSCFTTNPKLPECAIAFREEDVFRDFEAADLSPRRPPEYGWWCGRDRDGLKFGQDAVIGHKS